jgi:hypothetical protein
MQQKWRTLQAAVANADTEASEKKAVRDVLREEGYRKQASKINHKIGRKTVRVYLWRDTPIGTIALATGPSIKGEVFYMVPAQVMIEQTGGETDLYLPPAGGRPALASVPVPRRSRRSHESDSQSITKAMRENPAKGPQAGDIAPPTAFPAQANSAMFPDIWQEVTGAAFDKYSGDQVNIAAQIFRAYLKAFGMNKYVKIKAGNTYLSNHDFQRVYKKGTYEYVPVPIDKLKELAALVPGKVGLSYEPDGTLKKNFYLKDFKWGEGSTASKIDQDPGADYSYQGAGGWQIPAAYVSFVSVLTASAAKANGIPLSIEGKTYLKVAKAAKSQEAPKAQTAKKAPSAAPAPTAVPTSDADVIVGWHTGYSPGLTVYGNTFSYKEAIKALGFKWSGKSGKYSFPSNVWYFPLSDKGSKIHTTAVGYQKKKLAIEVAVDVFNALQAAGAPVIAVGWTHPTVAQTSTPQASEPATEDMAGAIWVQVYDPKQGVGRVYFLDTISSIGEGFVSTDFLGFTLDPDQYVWDPGYADDLSELKDGTMQGAQFIGTADNLDEAKDVVQTYLDALAPTSAAVPRPVKVAPTVAAPVSAGVPSGLPPQPNITSWEEWDAHAENNEGAIYLHSNVLYYSNEDGIVVLLDGDPFNKAEDTEFLWMRSPSVTLLRGKDTQLAENPDALLGYGADIMAAMSAAPAPAAAAAPVVAPAAPTPARLKKNFVIGDELTLDEALDALPSNVYFGGRLYGGSDGFQQDFYAKRLPSGMYELNAKSYDWEKSTESKDDLKAFITALTAYSLFFLGFDEDQAYQTLVNTFPPQPSTPSAVQTATVVPIDDTDSGTSEATQRRAQMAAQQPNVVVGSDPDPCPLKVDPPSLQTTVWDEVGGHNALAARLNNQPMGPQLGSTPGGTMTDPLTGLQFYVKFPKKAEHAYSEVFALAVYGALKIYTPQARVATMTAGGNTGAAVISPLLSGYSSAWVLAGKPANSTGFNDGELFDLARHAPIDALLANNDAIGAGVNTPYDNTLVNRDEISILKTLLKVEAGGALEWKGTGKKKSASEGWAGTGLMNLQNMLDPSVNKTTAAAFIKAKEDPSLMLSTAISVNAKFQSRFFVEKAEEAAVWAGYSPQKAASLVKRLSKRAESILDYVQTAVMPSAAPSPATPSPATPTIKWEDISTKIGHGDLLQDTLGSFWVVSGGEVDQLGKERLFLINWHNYDDNNKGKPVISQGEWVEPAQAFDEVEWNDAGGFSLANKAGTIVLPAYDLVKPPEGQVVIWGDAAAPDLALNDLPANTVIKSGDGDFYLLIQPLNQKDEVFLSYWDAGSPAGYLPASGDGQWTKATGWNDEEWNEEAATEGAWTLAPTSEIQGMPAFATAAPTPAPAIGPGPGAAMAAQDDMWLATISDAVLDQMAKPATDTEMTFKGLGGQAYPLINSDEIDELEDGTVIVVDSKQPDMQPSVLVKRGTDKWRQVLVKSQYGGSAVTATQVKGTLNDWVFSTSGTVHAVARIPDLPSGPPTQGKQIAAVALQAAQSAPPEVPKIRYDQLVSQIVDTAEFYHSFQPFPFSPVAWKALPKGSIIRGYKLSPNKDQSQATIDDWKPLLCWKVSETDWWFWWTDKPATTKQKITVDSTNMNQWMSRCFQTYLVRYGNDKAATITTAKKYAPSAHDSFPAVVNPYQYAGMDLAEPLEARGMAGSLAQPQYVPPNGSTPLMDEAGFWLVKKAIAPVAVGMLDAEKPNFAKYTAKMHELGLLLYAFTHTDSDGNKRLHIMSTAGNTPPVGGWNTPSERKNTLTKLFQTYRVFSAGPPPMPPPYSSGQFSDVLWRTLLRFTRYLQRAAKDAAYALGLLDGSTAAPAPLAVGTVINNATAARALPLGVMFTDTDGDKGQVVQWNGVKTAKIGGVQRKLDGTPYTSWFFPWTITAVPSASAPAPAAPAPAAAPTPAPAPAPAGLDWGVGDEVDTPTQALTLPVGTGLTDKDNDTVVIEVTASGKLQAKWVTAGIQPKIIENQSAQTAYMPWTIVDLPAGAPVAAPAPAPAAPPVAVPAAAAGLPADAPPVPLTVSLKPVWTEPVDLVAMRLTKVAEKPGGGNPGGVYQDTQTGKKYLVKHMSLEAVVVEVLTAALYRAGGVCAPDVRYASVADKGLSAISPWEEGIKKLSPPLTSGQKYYVREGMPFDMWLSNWDVAGLLMDNIVKVPNYPSDSPCSVMRIDVGGSLFLRANGGDKPTSGSKGYKADTPTEMTTFFDGTNPPTKKLFVEWSKVKPESWWLGVTSKSGIRRIMALCSDYGPGGTPLDLIIDWAVGLFALPRITELKSSLKVRAMAFADKILSGKTEEYKQTFAAQVQELLSGDAPVPAAPPPMTAPVDPTPATAPVAVPQPMTNDLPMPGSVWWFNRNHWVVWQETSSSQPVFVKVGSDGSYSTTALALSDAPANAQKLFARPAGESDIYIWPKSSLKSAIASAQAPSKMQSAFKSGSFAIGQEVTAQVFNQAPMGTMIQALNSPVSYVRQGTGQWLSVSGEVLTRADVATAYQSQDPAQTYKITGIGGVAITDLDPTAVVLGTAALLASIAQQ